MGGVKCCVNVFHVSVFGYEIIAFFSLFFFLGDITQKGYEKKRAKLLAPYTTTTQSTTGPSLSSHSSHFLFLFFFTQRGALGQISQNELMFVNSSVGVFMIIPFVLYFLSISATHISCPGMLSSTPRP